jgi:hypothetical protein
MEVCGLMWEDKGRHKRNLKKDETNKHRLGGKTKASEEIWWISHKCIPSKLQKCEHLQSVPGQHASHHALCCKDSVTVRLLKYLTNSLLLVRHMFHSNGKSCQNTLPINIPTWECHEAQIYKSLSNAHLVKLKQGICNDDLSVWGIK